MCGRVRRERLRVTEQRRDRRVRAAPEAYARLDVQIPDDGNAWALAKRVCRTVVRVSGFRRVASVCGGKSARVGRQWWWSCGWGRRCGDIVGRVLVAEARVGCRVEGKV
jgi:hypothetical protein